MEAGKEREGGTRAEEGREVHGKHFVAAAVS